jgi:ABC-type nitrate/sulfonate/bicarbonate transport system permease component
MQPVLWRAVGFGAFLLFWASYPGTPLTPSLGMVLKSGFDLVKGGVLVPDVVASLVRVVGGVAIAFALASFLCCVAVIVPKVGLMLEGIGEIFRPIPPIAWTPVAIIVFGIGNAPAVAIVGVGAFFPIWLGLQSGIEAVRQEHVQAAHTLGATRLNTARFVILPSVQPHAIRGLRLGTGLGWFSVVAAEMVGASSGLGYGIQLFSLNLEIEKMYAYLLMIGGLGWVQSSILRELEQAVFARWGISALN